VVGLSEGYPVKFLRRTLLVASICFLGGCGLYDQRRADYYNPPSCVYVTNYNLRLEGAGRFGTTNYGNCGRNYYGNRHK